MKALRVILSILSVFFVLGFITGVQSWSWSSENGTTVTHYHGWQRLLPLICALFCFGWVFGLTKRYIWGWYFGCVLFVLLIAQVLIFQALLPFLSEPTTGYGWWALLSQTVFAWIIFIALKKWWIPKRREFHPRDEA